MFELSYITFYIIFTAFDTHAPTESANLEILCQKLDNTSKPIAYTAQDNLEDLQSPCQS